MSTPNLAQPYNYVNYKGHLKKEKDVGYAPQKIPGTTNQKVGTPLSDSNQLAANETRYIQVQWEFQ